MKIKIDLGYRDYSTSLLIRADAQSSSEITQELIHSELERWFRELETSDPELLVYLGSTKEISLASLTDKILAVNWWQPVFPRSGLNLWCELEIKI